jgi:hypothetical protein
MRHEKPNVLERPFGQGKEFSFKPITLGPLNESVPEPPRLVLEKL